MPGGIISSILLTFLFESDCTWYPATFQLFLPAEFSSVCNLSSTFLFTVGASVVHVAASRIAGNQSISHLQRESRDTFGPRSRPQQGTRRWPQRGTAVRFVDIAAPIGVAKHGEAYRSAAIPKHSPRMSQVDRPWQVCQEHTSEAPEDLGFVFRDLWQTDFTGRQRLESVRNLCIIPSKQGIGLVVPCLGKNGTLYSEPVE
eukprot:s1052_g3.t1